MRLLYGVMLLAISSVMILVVNRLMATAAEFPQHPNRNTYRNAADLLESSLGSDLGEDRAALTSRLVRAVDEAVSILPPDSYVADRLRDIRQSLAGNEGASSNMESVTESVRAIVRDLRFVPRAEADLPEGFPAPTPVGEVEIKHYPVYRAAVTENGSAAFWRLFAHIKKNGVEMTAPVEMRYAPDSTRPVLMAFLYEGPKQGQTGSDGAVNVRDEPAAVVVSTGVRGSMTGQDLENAKKRVGQWLQKHADRYEPIGPPRVLGYNSPFVPRDAAYWEYQIPVREKNSG